MLQSSSENFPGIFGIFWVFFVPLNIFWAFPRFVFALKNISEKKLILPYWVEPKARPVSLRPGPTCRPAQGPSGHRPEAAAAWTAPPPGTQARVPIKGAAAPAAHASPS
jgi:hypothetical protein